MPDPHFARKVVDAAEDQPRPKTVREGKLNPVPASEGRCAGHVAGAGRRGDSEWTENAFKRFRWSEPVFVIALETGLSRTDLLSLKWTDVDETLGLIRLPRQKTKVFATIPISPECGGSEGVQGAPLL